MYIFLPKEKIIAAVHLIYYIYLFMKWKKSKNNTESNTKRTHMGGFHNDWYEKKPSGNFFFHIYVSGSLLFSLLLGQKQKNKTISTR